MYGAVQSIGQVEFNDTSESKDFSAVQVDATSSYLGEDTSFVGFAGEVCAGICCRKSYGLGNRMDC